VFVERFLREARSMAALSDPNIIQIYFIGQDEDQVFFAMEFIDGDSLSGWLKREGRLATGDALKILLQTSKGLAAAHAEGVIHRDIKPGNIMINNRGVVKVADFGIALASNDISSSKLTSTGALVGTPGYLPPEVCLGKAVDQRSDIFALGIVLFESLTGRMPFNDASPLKLMLEIVESNIPDIREFNPDVDEETVRILGRMLEKNPSDRYQSCDELCADLHKHPLANGPLQVKAKPADQASKETMVGAPTPGTGGHRPPRGATPPPQVGARTQPVMAQPQVAAAATIQTGSVAAPPSPPKKSKALPIALAALVLLALAGFGISRMLPFGGKPAVVDTGASTDANAAAAAAASAAPPPVAPPATPPAPPVVDTAAAGGVAAGQHRAGAGRRDTGACRRRRAGRSRRSSAKLVEEAMRKEAAAPRARRRGRGSGRKKRAAAAARRRRTRTPRCPTMIPAAAPAAPTPRRLRRAYLCRTTAPHC
jgi:serine/threonine-protein kinase